MSSYLSPYGIRGHGHGGGLLLYVLAVLALQSARCNAAVVSERFGDLRIRGNARVSGGVYRFTGRTSLGALQFDGSMSVERRRKGPATIYGRGGLVVPGIGRIAQGVLSGDAGGGLVFSPDRPGPWNVSGLGRVRFSSQCRLDCAAAAARFTGTLIYGANRRGRGPITVEGDLVFDGRSRVVKNDGAWTITTLMPRSRVKFRADGDLVFNYPLGILVGKGMLQYHDLRILDTRFTFTARPLRLSVDPGRIELEGALVREGGAGMSVVFDLRRATAVFTAPVKIFGVAMASASFRMVRSGEVILSAPSGRLGSLGVSSVRLNGRTGEYEMTFVADVTAGGFAFPGTAFRSSGGSFDGKGIIEWKDGTRVEMAVVLDGSGKADARTAEITRLRGLPCRTARLNRFGKRFEGEAKVSVPSVGDFVLPFSLDAGGTKVGRVTLSAPVQLYGHTLSSVTASVDRRGLVLDGRLSVGDRTVEDALFWYGRDGVLRGFGTLPVGRRGVPSVFFARNGGLGAIGAVPVHARVSLSRLTGQSRRGMADVEGLVKIALDSVSGALSASSDLVVSLPADGDEGQAASCKSSSALDLGTGLCRAVVPLKEGDAIREQAFDVKLMELLGF